MIEWSPQWVAVALSALALLCSAGVSIYTLYDRRRKAIELRVDALEREFAIIDVTVKSLPTSIAWSKMQNDITWIRGEANTTGAKMEGLDQALKRLERQIGLLYDHELAVGRGKSS